MAAFWLEKMVISFRAEILSKCSYFGFDFCFVISLLISRLLLAVVVLNSIHNTHNTSNAQKQKITSTHLIVLFCSFFLSFRWYCFKILITLSYSNDWIKCQSSHAIGLLLFMMLILFSLLIFLLLLFFYWELFHRSNFFFLLFFSFDVSLTSTRFNIVSHVIKCYTDMSAYFKYKNKSRLWSIDFSLLLSNAK